ncbi:hypothetical protein ACFVFS_28185 [Kitasatospora sp. NPDC057692]|uniref:hypothetical protein n=1 Tax=Kitasatospora sp. NPDC057692 TaxID=3346215 RepID=UPI0036B271E2
MRRRRRPHRRRARRTGADLATALTRATAATLTVARPGATPPDTAEPAAALHG